MRRDITSWYSHNLNMDMPLVAYGHAGYPLLMFPTAAADYLEYERFYLVDAIKDLINAGSIRAYSINSVNKYSLLNRESHPAWKVEMLNRYDRYIWMVLSQRMRPMPARLLPEHARAFSRQTPISTLRRVPRHDADERKLRHL